MNIFKCLQERARLRAQRRKHRLFFRSNEGNALLEFAFIVPVFLALITGIGSFGMALANQQTLVNATTAGAEYLQSNRGTSDPCAGAFSAIQNAAPGLNSSNIGLTVTMTDTSGNSTTVNSTSCSGDQNDLVEKGTVTVATTYPCNLSVYGYHFASSCQLSAKLTVYEY